jgi:glycosyltransferase involved in cell wall biosynthesis
VRILVVSHNYPRFSGDPAGGYVARLARAARAAGAEVHVIAPHVAGTAEDETDAGVPVHRFRYGPAFLERIGYRGDVRPSAFLSPLRLLLLPWYFIAFRRAVRRAVRSFNPDVIHAHWWFPAGWVVAGVPARRPYVVTCHGSDVRLLDRGAVFRHLARGVFGGAGAITTVSRFLSADLERAVGGLERSIQVAPMPLDVDRFAAGGAVPKTHPPRILYAGNLLESKGVDVLIRALRLLRDRGIDARLKILGEGPARPALEALARELGVTDRIEWSTFIPQDAMPAEYGTSTITVLPTRGRAEGLGLALVEALLAGSAVVGTPAGGIPEVVVDGETGLLARDGDPDDLAAKLARLLTDAALRERLVATGRTRMRETYAPAAAAGRFLALYDALARDHATR